MVKKESLKNAKEIITHFVAIILILQMIVFIWIGAFDKEFIVPAIAISLGSGAVGLYLSRYMKF
ncbi:MAG: hypothetical protein Q8L27_00665 [archaeon]|nr:hypothetical protein [archaeon]